MLYVINSDILVDFANKMRNKTGTTGELSLSAMSDMLDELGAGGGEEITKPYVVYDNLSYDNNTYGNVELHNFTDIPANMFKGSTITRITGCGSVTKVGASAFSGASFISCDFAMSRLTHIMDSAFLSSSLTIRRTFPPYIAFNNIEVIGANAFQYTTGIKKVFIPWYTAQGKETDMAGNLFYGCSKLDIYTDANSLPNIWSSNINRGGTTSSSLHTIHYGTSYEQFCTICGGEDKLNNYYAPLV